MLDWNHAQLFKTYFNPRTHEGCDACTHCWAAGSYGISIHVLVWGCDYSDTEIVNDVHISIHAPARGATKTRDLIVDLPFISIHAPARGATYSYKKSIPRQTISIHAPHAGCDTNRLRCHSGKQYFNPRTPCGVRLEYNRQDVVAEKFQSTHPRGVRRLHVNHSRARAANFNPRTREGCDAAMMTAAQLGVEPFQSTHPMRGATRTDYAVTAGSNISIHAPHAGCDLETVRDYVCKETDFNPRTPCGVRHKIVTEGIVDTPFQSTHPMRGATRGMLIRDY